MVQSLASGGGTSKSCTCRRYPEVPRRYLSERGRPRPLVHHYRAIMSSSYLNPGPSISLHTSNTLDCTHPQWIKTKKTWSGKLDSKFMFNIG